MKSYEKAQIFLLNLCVVILAIVCVMLGNDIEELKDRVNTLETRKAVSTLSMEVTGIDRKNVKADKYEYFDVSLDEELQEYIFDICDDYGIDPELIVSMIFHESNYDSAVIGTNDSGYSYGLMQIMPRWNQDRMEKLGCLDLLNPYQNVLVGVDLMAEYIGEGNGVAWALMAYNGGPSYANRKLAEGGVSGYAARVMDYAGTLPMAAVEANIVA